MKNEVRKELWPGWETVRVIGHGSFGAVYEIQRDVFGDTEKAALKVITIPKDRDEVETMTANGYDEESITHRFREYMQDIVGEYKLMSKMKGHANIVYCDDLRYVQHDDGIGWDIYIKMELLTPVLKLPKTHFDQTQLLHLGLDLCNALACCQAENIIHRDIKPQNIFVSRDGSYKLGDFGIAKTVEHTMGGTVTGTYPYMAPEVNNRQPYGSAVDIYSLGMVLYWLLNERRGPFLPLPPAVPSGAEESLAQNRRFSGEPLPAPAHGSEALKRIVLKACAFDPRQRYATAEEMRRELERLLYGRIREQAGEKRDANATVKASGRLDPEALTMLAREKTQPAKGGSSAQRAPDRGAQQKKALKAVGTVALLAVLAIGAVAVMVNGGRSGETPEETGESASTVQTEDPQERIDAAVAEADALAAQGDLEGALTRIQAALTDAPDSELLLEKETAYAAQLEQATMDSVLAQAQAYADAEDYVSAMAVIQNAQQTHGDRPEYQQAYETYHGAYAEQQKPPAPTIQMDKIVSVTASSTLREKHVQHVPERIVDGKLTTAWVEAADGQGTGESVTVTFDGVYTVSAFTIHAGYHLDTLRYTSNSRPKEVTVSFSDGTVYTFTLSDTMNGQTVLLPEPVETDCVVLTILSVYPGSKYEDTCISEISFS